MIIIIMQSGTLKEKVTEEVREMLEQFKKKCVSRIQDQSDEFGPPEFKTGMIIESEPLG